MCEKKQALLIVERQLQSIQYELQMDKSDMQDKITQGAEDVEFIDYDKEFALYIEDFLIKPFGRTLAQDLMDLLTKRLDLSESIIK